MNLKIKTSYSWEELADGTRTKPGSRFLAMLEDYVTWSKIDTGLPHRYDSVLAEHELNRPLFLTDVQAKCISEGLVYLQFAEPFAYRVFWKYYFTGTPISVMRKNCNFNYELRSQYSWDGSDEALAFGLKIARAYLFDYICLLAKKEKEEKSKKINKRNQRRR